MELQTMNALHKYIMSLPHVYCTVASANIVISYKVQHYLGMPQPKFATLNGAKK